MRAKQGSRTPCGHSSSCGSPICSNANLRRTQAPESESVPERGRLTAPVARPHARKESCSWEACRSCWRSSSAPSRSCSSARWRSSRAGETGGVLLVSIALGFGLALLGRALRVRRGVRRPLQPGGDACDVPRQAPAGQRTHRVLGRPVRGRGSCLARRPRRVRQQGRRGDGDDGQSGVRHGRSAHRRDRAHARSSSRSSSRRRGATSAGGAHSRRSRSRSSRSTSRQSRSAAPR